MNIRKDKVLAAMVRSFFEAFSSGIIDCTATTPQERQSPQVIKRLMLNHYEHIAPAFLNTLFYPLAAMNFDYATMERMVQEAQRRGDDMMSLVHEACASDALYEVMTTEYKRNFSNLLAGRYASAAEHLASYASVSNLSDASVESSSINFSLDTDVAIRLLVRVVMRAYVAGLRQVADGDTHFRQPTLFRLMLDAMNVLLLDEAVTYDDCDDDLSAMFLKVCRNEHNFVLMTQEMDQVHEELIHPSNS